MSSALKLVLVPAVALATAPQQNFLVQKAQGFANTAPKDNEAGKGESDPSNKDPKPKDEGNDPKEGGKDPKEGDKDGKGGDAKAVEITDPLFFTPKDVTFSQTVVRDILKNAKITDKAEVDKYFEAICATKKGDDGCALYNLGGALLLVKPEQEAPLVKAWKEAHDKYFAQLNTQYKALKTTDSSQAELANVVATAAASLWNPWMIGYNTATLTCQSARKDAKKSFENKGDCIAPIQEMMADMSHVRMAEKIAGVNTDIRGNAFLAGVSSMVMGLVLAAAF